MKSTKIGVVGLGYVGLTFAISLAKRGFKVNGYENNLNLIKDVLKIVDKNKSISRASIAQRQGKIKKGLSKED